MVGRHTAWSLSAGLVATAGSSRAGCGRCPNARPTLAGVWRDVGPAARPRRREMSRLAAGRLGVATPRGPAVCRAPGESGRGSSHTREPPGHGPPAPGLTQSWAGSQRTLGSRHGPPVLALSGCSGQGLPAGHAHKSHVAGFAPWQGLALDAHAAVLLSSWGCGEEDPWSGCLAPRRGPACVWQGTFSLPGAPTSAGPQQTLSVLSL